MHRNVVFAATRGLQRLAIVLCAIAPLGACVIPIPVTDTSYDGVPSGTVRRAASKPELMSRVAAPDAATADGRFLLYRFNTEREWALLWVGTETSGELDLGKGHKRLDMVIEFDANNLAKHRTSQSCVETYDETPCDVSNEDALWALIERRESRAIAPGYRESQATIAALIEPLHTAATNGDAAEVGQLLTRGASPHSEVEGQTPLHVAAANGWCGVMKVLVSAGAGIDVRGPSGQTPLFMAAASGQTEAVTWLIEHGANKKIVDLLGETPLHAASRNLHSATVRAFAPSAVAPPTEGIEQNATGDCQ
jgi:hypothetical protein